MVSELREQIIETKLFADYFQFYLQDDDISKGNTEDLWTDEAIKRLLAVAPFVVGIGTERNMTVLVKIQVCEKFTDLNFDNYDLVNECGLEIETGRINISGCTDNFHEALKIEVPKGLYELIIGYGNLNSIEDEQGLDGDDSYDVFIKPANKFIQIKTLKDIRK
jgi:hypothetical protein